MNLFDKINLFKIDGLQKLQIISDFDATLTKAWDENDNRGVNSISVFRVKNYINDHYVKESTDLANYYHPIEQDHTIPVEKRREYMIEWWSKHFDLLVKHGLDKKSIDEVVEKDHLELRDGFHKLFDVTKKYNIPFLIFSAGVGDVIRGYAKKYGKGSNIHIVSNKWNFDENGKFIGIEGEIIHSLNKNMVEVKTFPYYFQVANRKNIILIGDSIGDLGMVEGFDYDNIIKIGFFNKKKSDDDYGIAKKMYEKNFDLIIEDDGPLDKIYELIEFIAK